MKYGNIILNHLLLFLFLFPALHCSSSGHKIIKSDVVDGEGEEDWNFPYKKLGVSRAAYLKLDPILRDKDPTAIILHTTGGLEARDYAELALSEKFFIHMLIDKKGRVFSENKIENVSYRLVPKMDLKSIHVSIEGRESEILKNTKLVKVLSDEIKKLSIRFSIPLNNKNISSMRGVFTHTQAKKKFGNFIDLDPCGGEDLLKSVLDDIGGNYFEEKDWTERFSKEWTLRKENPDIEAPKEEFNRGRGITTRPFAGLESIEQDDNGLVPEDYRVKYTFDGKMDPTCVVLHYTAIPSFKDSLATLERRGLSASIMVDKDGKAYQLVDVLDHSARAAGGTNKNCVQIEIVGSNTKDLMGNKKQFDKVVKILHELSQKYYIPITNQRIESYKGIFSHTQAKKKWGMSVHLSGKDFDPGEEYMKKVILALGGIYSPEEEWYDRKSDDWVILFGEFQP
ncbi:MAG: N-acetylmuramoyl-L-alanine amidase [Leptospiraceae bacterium]|nr:N-acetylmuramoyl-L-alanine amidase [Leptospiraceae bacterium]